MRFNFLVAILILVLASVLSVGGSVVSLISFNFWLDRFDYGSGPVTVQIIAAIFYVIFFVPPAIAICALDMWRGKLNFVSVYLQPRQLSNIILLAAMDTWIDISTTFAAPHTSIITQAFARATEPIFVFLLSRWLIRQKYPILSKLWLLILALLSILTGVFLHFFSALFLSDHKSSASYGYLLLYFSSVISSIFYGIFQSRFVRDARLRTREVAEEENVKLSLASKGDESITKITPEQIAPNTQIRAIALAGDMIFTLIFSSILGSTIDVIPGFGDADTYREVWSNFADGTKCIFQCSGNLAMALTTLGCWAIVYLGDVISNPYSPTLTSIIGQTAAPLTVLVVIIFPGFRDGTTSPVATPTLASLNSGSLAVLTIGIGLYIWYEFTYSSRSAEAAGALYMSPIRDASMEFLATVLDECEEDVLTEQISF